jgi:hypothetical protein
LLIMIIKELINYLNPTKIWSDITKKPASAPEVLRDFFLWALNEIKKPMVTASKGWIHWESDESIGNGIFKNWGFQWVMRSEQEQQQ